MRTNPFFELYVGDRISSKEFATIFSPFLVQHAEALFLPGNIVVTGIQGSGKSMLLSLLKPEIRIEYSRAEEEFPVRRELRKFIGAGINLTHSNAVDFGNRRLSGDKNEIALLFGDFVNYVISLDLLKSVETLASAQNSLEVAVRFDQDRQMVLAELIQKDPAWTGYFDRCVGLDAIRRRMGERVSAYRRYLHMNDEKFDDEIRRTKTGIGMAINSLVRNLRRSTIIDDDLNVFVHVDQYEELASISTGADGQPIDYRAVINRAIARRDPLVSYRIGSRGHAWHRHGLIFGTAAKLEEERDYKFINLDQMLRRHENRKTWVFPGFAADVFGRRLRYASLAAAEVPGKTLLRRVFGAGMTAEEKARRYSGGVGARAVRLEPGWPENIKAQLLAIAEHDPLSARLGESWYLQKGVADQSGEPADQLPWTARKRQWWRKERVELALIQIAGRCQQRPFWCGQDEIVDLSGGNILTFLSICQFIWDAAMQASEFRGANHRALDGIDEETQAVGIFKASDYWLKKIAQETGNSGNRLRFVRHLGNVLGRGLLADRKLSNPGHNGFSVPDEDLDRNPPVREFLEELSDYGNLLNLPHTTKEKDRRSRTKWYLTPILCPQFKIPYKRLKEPRYVKVDEVASWMADAGIRIDARLASPRRATQEPDSLPLFKDLSK